MIFYSPYLGAEMLRSYKWMGMDGYGIGNICVGLFYEHRFAVLISGVIFWDFAKLFWAHIYRYDLLDSFTQFTK